MMIEIWDDRNLFNDKQNFSMDKLLHNVDAVLCIYIYFSDWNVTTGTMYM